MRGSVGKSSFVGILVMLVSTVGIVAAAQPGKTKPEKTPVVKEDPGPWLLAGREGECVPLSILEKKGPEYSDVQGPYQLAEKLRAGGHNTEVKEYNAGVRPAVEVRAPSAGLAVMFIKKDLCGKTSPGAEK
jgi:hypothetical protein